jgi:hypothetical protein
MDAFLVAVMDGDNVEEKNLSRQMFRQGDITVNKATAAVGRFPDNFPLVAIPAYLGVEGIEMIGEETIVLICVDNMPVRALIEDHCSTLNDCVVINGGNEEDTGSVQIWIRKDGKDVTPKLTFMHPEIRTGTEDRATMSCVQVAAIKGGEQLITANMSSALWILQTLMAYHNNEIKYTEVQFSLKDGKTYGMDLRDVDKYGWES